MCRKNLVASMLVKPFGSAKNQRGYTNPRTPASRTSEKRVNLYTKWQLENTSYYELIKIYKCQFVVFKKSLLKSALYTKVPNKNNAFGGGMQTRRERLKSAVQFTTFSIGYC